MEVGTRNGQQCALGEREGLEVKQRRVHAVFTQSVCV